MIPRSDREGPATKPLRHLRRPPPQACHRLAAGPHVPDERLPTTPEAPPRPPPPHHGMVLMRAHPPESATELPIPTQVMETQARNCDTFLGQVVVLNSPD